MSNILTIVVDWMIKLILLSLGLRIALTLAWSNQKWYKKIFKIVYDITIYGGVTILCLLCYLKFSDIIYFFKFSMWYYLIKLMIF